MKSRQEIGQNYRQLRQDQTDMKANRTKKGKKRRQERKDSQKVPYESRQESGGKRVNN